MEQTSIASVEKNQNKTPNFTTTNNTAIVSFMFAYLTKKISIPNGSKACSVAWNNESNLLAVGASDNVLRLLRLDSPGSNFSATSSSNEDQAVSSGKTALSVSQTLNTHKGHVIQCAWNKKFKKLTSVDSSGLIIVWALQTNGSGSTATSWKEDMFNSRNGIQVTHLQWSRDGKKICIAYVDGMVVMGEVDGNRLWGKALTKSGHFKKLAWSPDGQNILFATADGDLQLYDSEGNFLAKAAGLEKRTVTSMDWYDDQMGHSDGNFLALAVAYDNGKLLMMKHARDDNPLVIETGLSDMKVSWNPNGTVIAIFGNRTGSEDKSVPQVTFISNQGQFMRALKLGSGQTAASANNTGITWDFTGSRLAIAIDSYLYFANVYYEFKWCYALDSIVFAYGKQGEAKSIVCFWNILTQEKILKTMASLQMITSCEDQVALISKQMENDGGSFSYIITLANAIGVFLDVKMVNLVPKLVCMNKNFVYVSDGNIVYYWQYKDSSVKTGRKLNLEGSKRNSGKERYFAVDDLCQKETQRTSYDQINVEASNALFDKKTSNSVVSLACSEKYLAVGREDGSVSLLTLPHLFFDRQIAKISEPPRLISLNCNDSKVGVANMLGVFTIFTVKNGEADESLAKFERKDVWDFKWALDDPDSIAVMEKNRLFVFRGIEPEEPLSNYGYLCEFKDLQIKLVKINEILADPENPNNDSLVLVETKSLRDSRTMLSQIGLKETMQYIEEHPHPRLWKLLADSALEEMDLETATKGFVRSVDYYGISVVKNLLKLDSDEKRRAEVALYFSEFDSAESMYLEMDRKDLAIQMRKKLGDWFSVLQLMKSGGYVEDETLEFAWNSIGDYYFDRRNWKQASEFYAMSKNYTRLVDCYYFEQDFESLERLMMRLPDHTPVLRLIADRFSSIGMCYEASLALIKLSDIESAIHLCINNHRWSTAIQIAEKYKYADLDNLLHKYAEHLVSKGKILESVELFRKSNYPQKAAQWLLQIVQDLKESKTNRDIVKTEPGLLKQLYVLAGLEVERWRLQNRQVKGFKVAEDEDIKDMNFFHTRRKIIPLKDAWRGAIAFHYMLLSQKLYYSKNYVDSLRAALYLRDYEDILGLKMIYMQISLTALHANYLAVASRALTKVERCDQVSATEKQLIRELALAIYSKHPPTNPKSAAMTCTSCGSQMTNFDCQCPTCEQSYQISFFSAEILTEEVVSCIYCKQSIAESEAKLVSNCLVCHQKLSL